MGARAHGKSEVKSEGPGQKDQAVYEDSPKRLHCRRHSFEKVTVPPTSLTPRRLNTTNAIPLTRGGGGLGPGGVDSVTGEAVTR